VHEPYDEGIDEAEVAEIEIANCSQMGIYEPDDIGKTVFLTREAASMSGTVDTEKENRPD
jgi:hypothetical protein